MAHTGGMNGIMLYVSFYNHLSHTLRNVSRCLPFEQTTFSHFQVNASLDEQFCNTYYGTCLLRPGYNLSQEQMLTDEAAT